MAYEFFQYGQPHPCLVVNPQPSLPTMTIPIAGVPRGGTTMVAAAVHALGVDLGPAKDFGAHTFEDQSMNGELHTRLSYIKRRNAERQVWGWKDPTAIVSMRELFFALRNPRLILVFRDMMATIDSEMRFDEAMSIEPRRSFADLAEATTNWWASNMEFISRTTFPTLLVSYERALQHPETFVNQLAAFLGLTPTQEQVQEAMIRINPRGGYLKMDEQGQPIRVLEPPTETVPEAQPLPPG